MYRVVTDCRDHRGNRLLEPGPWFSLQTDAEYWAELLRNFGYRVSVEKLDGSIAAHRHEH